MKTHLIKASLLLMALSLALSAAAHAETYPVYEVTTRPAFLRAEPGFPEDDSGGYGNILAGVPEGAEHKVIVDRTEAIRWALKFAREGDVILLAGKGHEEYEIDASGKHPYSERKIVMKEMGEKSE